MRVLRLIPVFVFFLLLGSQVLLGAGQAYAQNCCMCSVCWPGFCDCPGYAGCPWCRADDSGTSQSNASADEGANQSSVLEPLHSTVAKSNVSERFKELMRGGKPILANFTLKLLDSFDGRKFTCPSSDQKSTGNTLLQFVRAYIQGEPR